MAHRRGDLLGNSEPYRLPDLGRADGLLHLRSDRPAAFVAATEWIERARR